MRAARIHRGVGAALVEGLGFAAVGFLGGEALFAPSADGVPLAATLAPAIAAGVGAFTYRVVWPPP